MPNACALGRDARRSDLVVTSGLLRRLDPIELEGVIAHELAHVKRGDNGVSCVGDHAGGVPGTARSMLRRCVGGNREYRADVVGASAVRYPRGLLEALDDHDGGARPRRSGSFFASPARFGGDPLGLDRPVRGAPGRARGAGRPDATSVRAAALNEW